MGAKCSRGYDQEGLDASQSKKSRKLTKKVDKMLMNLSVYDDKKEDYKLFNKEVQKMLKMQYDQDMGDLLK